MDEEIDTRKINNSFLRDHNYATEADIISTVEFNPTGELLATGDKGGRVVVFQREQESKNQPHRRGEYNVYSTFQILGKSSYFTAHLSTLAFANGSITSITSSVA
uniref:Serine/threonine-protein phosphatase 2A 55 kDa regulatory subunit B beta isoform n=1 Tax=Salmo trutta TaxID=8032 RepID=A0A673Y0Y6_SALTR